MNLLNTKESQNYAFEILKFITAICENQNIKYFLIWGTLIGAVRHSGFIPWDDDIDICMPRNDYNRFIKYMESMKSSRYKLYIEGKSKNYYLSLPRVVDTETVIIGERKENENQLDCGIFVDIYPLDFVGSTKKECESYFKKQIKYEWLKGLSQQKSFVKSRSSIINTIIKIPFYFYSKTKGTDFFYKKMEKLANSKHSFENNYCCSCYGTGGMNYNKLIFKSNLFGEGRECMFNGYSFKIPIGYDEILKQVYGDYMQLPPVHERVGHHEYKAYKL